MGGSAKKPDDPPPAPAPVRADQVGGEQAIASAGRRQGLRKTIMSTANNYSRPTLGASTVLGMGGEGAMTNNVVAPVAPIKNTKGGTGKL